MSPRQSWYLREFAETLRYELAQQSVPSSLHVDGFPAPRPELVYVLVAPHEYVALEGIGAVPDDEILKSHRLSLRSVADCYRSGPGRRDPWARGRGVRHGRAIGGSTSPSRDPRALPQTRIFETSRQIRPGAGPDDRCDVPRRAQRAQDAAARALRSGPRAAQLLAAGLRRLPSQSRRLDLIHRRPEMGSTRAHEDPVQRAPRRRLLP